jgi:hypothetical protein
MPILRDFPWRYGDVPASQNAEWLRQFGEELAAKQEPLGKEFAEILSKVPYAK